MSAKTVLLIWSNPLFLDSIQSLLKNPDVVCVSFPFDLLTINKEIQRVHPDVVIIEKTEDIIPLNLMEIFNAHSRNMRIFKLSLAHNELNVYNHQQMMIARAEDLLNLILN